MVSFLPVPSGIPAVLLNAQEAAAPAFYSSGGWREGVAKYFATFAV
jgi:hypothetical protein